jgi:hypothetical protein
VNSQTNTLDSETLLTFSGYALGFSFNLYVQHLIPKDTLCEVVILQEGVKRYIAFQSDNIYDSHKAARDYLFNIELTEGYDVATIVFDGYTRTVGAQWHASLLSAHQCGYVAGAAHHHVRR